jgi:hypothetical protein
MSSKATIIISKTVHVYEETQSPIYFGDEFKGWEIVIEDDESEVVLKDPNDELYKLLITHKRNK